MDKDGEREGWMDRWIDRYSGNIKDFSIQTQNLKFLVSYEFYNLLVTIDSCYKSFICLG